MKPFALPLAAIGLSLITAVPAFADPGRGHGHGKHARHEHRDEGRHARPDDRHRADCPPGLARKNPPCVPPGQARGPDRYGDRVGDRLRIGDYIILRDAQRHDLPTRPDWRYYRDDDRIYRVDNDTQRILAVINLIDAFTN